jgi:hypothetical protein
VVEDTDLAGAEVRVEASEDGDGHAQAQQRRRGVKVPVPEVTRREALALLLVTGSEGGGEPGISVTSGPDPPTAHAQQPPRSQPASFVARQPCIA